MSPVLFYTLLLAQEQFYYISVVAEIFNISYILGTIYNISFSGPFMEILSFFNFLYLIYIFLIIFTTKGKFKRLGFIISALALLSAFVFKENIYYSLIDSLICIFALIYYHRFIYVAIGATKAMIERIIKERS